MKFEEARAAALSLPEVVEVDHHGKPSFRVGGRIFCTLRPGEPRMMVKLSPEDQHNLVEANPRLLSPVDGYWGRKGSTFVDLAVADGPLVQSLLHTAWLSVAPKRTNRRP